MEIVGGKTELTEEDLKRDRTCIDTAIATAKAWRRADPSVKLVMGNSVESYGLLARVFRTGMPKDLVDFVGEETVGQSTPPEETTARVPWMQREIARTLRQRPSVGAVSLLHTSAFAIAPCAWKGVFVKISLTMVRSHGNPND